MDYLTHALGIKVEYHDWDGASRLAYMLIDRYQFRVATLDDLKTLFVCPLGEMEPVSVLQKHLALIAKSAQLPTVLILEKCTARQRRALIDHRIPFIVKDKQIYLPFMGTLLQDPCDPQAAENPKLLPSAQLLLFYYIYRRRTELPMCGLSEPLHLTNMSVSRAARQLEEMHLLRSHKAGVSKIISSDLHGQDLYEKASAFLRSPVKKRGFVDCTALNAAHCVAGLSALSRLTLLNPPRVAVFAMEKLPDPEIHLEKRLTDESVQQCVEIWSYNPLLLAKDGCVDILSLHQALKEDPDERVQNALNICLKKFWEEYDGPRN